MSNLKNSKTPTNVPEERSKSNKSRLYTRRDMSDGYISKSKKITSLVRRTEYDVDGETIIKSETFRVHSVLWRDEQGRFISPKKVKVIESTLSKMS
jgi:hypothetical protein